MSCEPPAAMGTTKRTGRDGYACAQATREKTGSAAALAVTQKLSAGKFHPSLISLFDHLVGAGEQRRRNFEAKRLGGRQVDDEIELGRLLDRQVGGVCAF